MQLNKLFLKVTVCLFLAVLLFQSCADEEAPGVSPPAASSVKIKFSAFPASSAGDSLAERDDRLTSVKAWLFENGILSEVWEQIPFSGEGYELKLDKVSGRLYAVAAEDGLAMDMRDAVVGTLTEQEWLKATVKMKGDELKHFATGSLDLSAGESRVSSSTLVLKRGIARFDLQIEPDQSIEVESLTLKNALQDAYCFPQESVTVPEDAVYGDHVVRFSSPLTSDSLGVVHVYEQANPELKVCIDAKVSGSPVRLEEKMPEVIRRNSVYVVKVKNEEQGLQLSIEEWNKEHIDLDVSVSSRLKIASASVLPEGVEVADEGSTLKLPHAATDFVFGVDCGNELELVSAEGSALVQVEAVPQTGANLYRVRKPLYVPNHPQEEVVLQFRRKGLTNAYPEDCIRLSASPNPVTVSGLLAFDPETYACDFGRYIDNELGVLSLPDGKQLSVEFDRGEDPWIKIDGRDSSGACRVIAGWKPNDKTADGRVQAARLVISDKEDASRREEYVVKRRNYGLPVTWFHGVWWCKYNARGNSKSFDDQILSSSDPAEMAGKTVYDYLASCPAEDFLDLWKWEYMGDSGMGMEVVDDGGKLVLAGYNNGEKVHLNKLPANALSPEGYELPSFEEFNRVFDATDYIWMMWNGSHKLKVPWEGHEIVNRERFWRNGLQLGTVPMQNIIICRMSSPDFPEHEGITWYGASAQWNSDGIRHADHYNNILFAMSSATGQGWYIAGGLDNLYLNKNGAGANNSRVLRFKKSPVEYIYGNGE